MQIPASPARRHAIPPSTPSAKTRNNPTADDAPALFLRGIVWCMRGDDRGDDAPLCHWLPAPQPRAARGGLSGWQRKAVAAHIEANLGAVLRLAALAQIVRLSPFHFARAFKQSFGVPPHRYHVGRRIARAKDLLADPANSVTAIAREVGFAETSSFSSTFRRMTGASPSIFRRGGLEP